MGSLEFGKFWLALPGTGCAEKKQPRSHKFLCLRVGKPMKKTFVSNASASMQQYAQQGKKHEYWFAVPQERSVLPRPWIQITRGKHEEFRPCSIGLFVLTVQIFLFKMDSCSSSILYPSKPMKCWFLIRSLSLCRVLFFLCACGSCMGHL